MKREELDKLIKNSLALILTKVMPPKDTIHNTHHVKRKKYEFDCKDFV